MKSWYELQQKAEKHDDMIIEGVSIINMFNGICGELASADDGEILLSEKGYQSRIDQLEELLSMLENREV